MTIINHRCAVLGKPIAHSLSPVLHNAAYRAMGLDDWHYGKYEVGEGDLEGFLRSLDPQWAGLSLTMPLKKTIQPYGEPSNMWARELNVANTVVFDWAAPHHSGISGIPAIRLYNTDVMGIQPSSTPMGFVGLSSQAIDRERPSLSATATRRPRRWPPAR